jgi:hypothetical protein
MAINGCDTLRPQDMYFRPFTNSVRDTKFHNDVGGGRGLWDRVISLIML